MRHQPWVALTALCAICSGVYAKDLYDGKTSLLCTMQSLYECDSQYGCKAAEPDAAARLRHLVFDFERKEVRRDEEGAKQTSRITAVEAVDDNLLVQGWDAGQPDVADGAGWTMSIDRRYGTMVATISGKDVAFVSLGNCIPAGK